MALAYTPGLKVKASTVVRAVRRLPVPGEVLVNEGDMVDFDTVVARTSVPGGVEVVKLVHLLGIDPEDVGRYLRKKVGDEVKEGEIIAEKKGFLGMFRSVATSPTTGVIQQVSELTGQVTISEPPVPIEIKAYVPGRIEKVLSNEGCIVRTEAALIQGIFGVGGETHGQLTLAVDSPDEMLTEEKISADHAGKVVIGGSLVKVEALRKAASLGVRGIVVGGIEDKDLSDFLGYEIGVAITGHENIGLTLIVTEGFGTMRMSERTFNLLRSLEGKEAAINGATQIRAGVIRPEIIVPQPEVKRAASGAESSIVTQRGMEPGMAVRIIREPDFGKIGKIVRLPVDLQVVETESPVRVLEVELEDGRNVIVPRADVEIIEE
jgi:hypothetical protein